MATYHSAVNKCEKQLPFTIYKVSSFSQLYPPKNILEDKIDESSRWCSESSICPQFITLRLSRPSIVSEITFGKLEHNCNLKRFKVYGGMSEDSMIEILENGLKNDKIEKNDRNEKNDNYETFRLKHSKLKKDVPFRFIKVVPLQTWGGCHYNYSVWFIQLRGYDDYTLVKESLHWFNDFKQREAIRLCLKHLRQKNYCEAFESLQKRTKVQLEDKLLTNFHKLLVIDGNYELCEKLVDEAFVQGMFDSYIRKIDYKPVWKPIMFPPKTDRPGMRGGHQMCIDPYAETIYLFGGWDGTRDLSDLWSYHIPSAEWVCISSNTSLESGPSARSCHKMCLDPIRKKIYTLGRYLDSTIRSVENLKSDFYVYDIQLNEWTQINTDTHSMGGPKLVFDHQMCIDLKNNTIYVFGGKILSCDERSLNCHEPPLFSGLFTYNVNNNTWNKVRDDSQINSQTGSHDIRSRIGHSMLFHEKLRLLYIFAGQRGKDHFKDLFTYNVDTDEVVVIHDGLRSEVPAAGFTQRATIDPENNEIHVLSGLNKEKQKDEVVKNSFWVYDILHDRWSCIYRNENHSENNNGNNGGSVGTNNNNNSANIANSVESPVSCYDKSEPCPRYAHQLVYDHIKKVHYLFGGNPGRNQSPKLRLDDFWTLELSRITVRQLLRRCKRLIREQNFKEIIQRNESSAVSYLQNQLSETFDHSVPDEIKAFQSLASLIFKEDPTQVELNPELDPDYNYINRTKVFDSIVEYFPEDMTQPKGNLVDLVLS